MSDEELLPPRTVAVIAWTIEGNGDVSPKIVSQVIPSTLSMWLRNCASEIDALEAAGNLKVEPVGE